MKIDRRDFCEKSSRKEKAIGRYWVRFLQTEIYNSRLKNISTSLINQETNKDDKLSLPANLRRAGKSILDFSAKLKQSLCDIF